MYAHYFRISRQFFTDRESFKGWRTDISILDFYTLYIYLIKEWIRRIERESMKVDDGNSSG